MIPRQELRDRHLTDNMTDSSSWVDKEGYSLDAKQFYDVDPYSTPHILTELTGQGAVFENFRGERDTLNQRDVAHRVKKYTPEEARKLVRDWPDSLKNELVNFVNANLDKWGL